MNISVFLTHSIYINKTFIDKACNPHKRMLTSVCDSVATKL